MARFWEIERDFSVRVRNVRTGAYLTGSTCARGLPNSRRWLLCPRILVVPMRSELCRIIVTWVHPPALRDLQRNSSARYHRSWRGAGRPMNGCSARRTASDGLCPPSVGPCPPHFPEYSASLELSSNGGGLRAGPSRCQRPASCPPLVPGALDFRTRGRSSGDEFA